MSITVQYLFNTDSKLLALAQDVNRVLGCSLAPYEGDSDDQFCRFFGMEFSLSADHGLEHDRDLNFEDYRWILEARTPSPDSDLRSVQVEVMVLVAYVLQQRLGITQGMLSFDVQRLLARYELVDRAWTDVLSGRKVAFPEHLADVIDRLAD